MFCFSPFFQQSLIAYSLKKEVENWPKLNKAKRLQIGDFPLDHWSGKMVKHCHPSL
jgi:hypothetical protein